MAQILRKDPNIIITGTPGVGKTTLSEEVAQKTGLKHINISDLVKEKGIGEKPKNPEDDTLDVDEDRLLDILENPLEDGGVIIDWHACDLFPPHQIDLVCVVRCDNKILYDRLQARKYAEKKLQENLDCEIMEVILQEARDAFPAEQVVELQGEKVEDVDANVQRIETWVGRWRDDHSGEGVEVKGQKDEEGKRDEDDPMFLHG